MKNLILRQRIMYGKKRKRVVKAESIKKTGSKLSRNLKNLKLRRRIMFGKKRKRVVKTGLPSGTKDSSVLGSVWFIETAPENEDDERAPLRGGGLCIDKRGLIITVAHIVTIEGLHQNKCLIRARSNKDSSLDTRRVEVIGILSQFDLALLRVSLQENEVLEFVRLVDSVQVDIDEEVFGYIHQDGLLFTENSGYTCYPLPESVDLPAMTDYSTIRSSHCLDRNSIYLANQPYRTVSSITRSKDENFFDLHPKLPLVQVDGFGTNPGASGCPLFKNKGEELIGLFGFQKVFSHYIIPVNIMRRFVDYYLDKRKLFN